MRLTAGEPPLAATASAGTMRIVALAALTAVAAWFGQEYAVLSPEWSPAVYPAAGVALAGVLLGGFRLWPGIVIGILVVELSQIAATGGSFSRFVAALAIAFALALQAVIAAALFRAVAGNNDPFHRSRDAGWFVVLAGMLACVICPTVNAMAAGLIGSLPWEQWSERWLQSWFANHNGVLLVAPLILAWACGGRVRFGPWQGPELVLLATAPAVICLAVRYTGYSLEYLYLPLLAWAAFRFGPRGATAMTLVVASLAVAAASNHYGSFRGETPAVSHFLITSFIGAIEASTLVLLGVIAQRDAAEHGLADAHATLENRVRLRTQELAAANGRLRRIADLDGLTGIPNRRYFNTALANEWRRAEQAARSVAVILMDVDYFKLFNDTYGHLAGDGCLQSIADTLAAGLQRGGELLARYGGEEFVALLPNVDAAEAVRTAERLRQRVANLAIPHCMPTEGSHVTLSAGVAADVPLGRRAPADLVASADAALYTAKHAGRDRVVAGN
jgi:diguanylate cyclase (GGDEF)-like protein